MESEVLLERSEIVNVMKVLFEEYNADDLVSIKIHNCCKYDLVFFFLGLLCGLMLCSDVGSYHLIKHFRVIDLSSKLEFRTENTI